MAELLTTLKELDEMVKAYLEVFHAKALNKIRRKEKYS